MIEASGYGAPYLELLGELHEELAHLLLGELVLALGELGPERVELLRSDLLAGLQPELHRRRRALRMDGRISGTVLSRTRERDRY